MNEKEFLDEEKKITRHQKETFLPMNDLSGKPFRNRAIVVVYSYMYGLQYGVIEEIQDNSVRVIIKLPAGEEIVEEIQRPSTSVLMIGLSSTPYSIKERLIELSDVRISGPNELSRNSFETPMQ